MDPAVEVKCLREKETRQRDSYGTSLYFSLPFSLALFTAYHPRSFGYFFLGSAATVEWLVAILYIHLGYQIRALRVKNSALSLSDPRPLRSMSVREGSLVHVAEDEQ